MDLRAEKRKQQEIFIDEGKKALKQLFSKEGYKQIPNLLTASRGISPLVILPFILTSNLGGAIISEICFALTDFFDGFIARKYNLYSEFGKKLDTVCDKIFAISLLLPILSFIPATGISIGLEVLIGAINSISMLKGNDPKSSLLGKCKTASLSLTIVLTYFSIFTKIPQNILLMSLGITTLFQGTAAFDYYITDKIKDVKKEEKTETEKTHLEEIDNKQDEKTNDEIKENTKHNVDYKNNFPPEVEETFDNIKKLIFIKKD